MVKQEYIDKLVEIPEYSLSGYTLAPTMIVGASGMPFLQHQAVAASRKKISPGPSLKKRGVSISPRRSPSGRIIRTLQRPQGFSRKAPTFYRSFFLYAPKF
jgi:hypothetical protein